MKLLQKTDFVYLSRAFKKSSAPSIEIHPKIMYESWRSIPLKINQRFIQTRLYVNIAKDCESFKAIKGNTRLCKAKVILR